MSRLAFAVCGKSVYVDASVPACLAALFAADASVYTALVLLAAVLHEAGHFALLRLYRVRVSSVRVCPFGAVIDADVMCLPPVKEALVSLAGVAVNLLLGAVFLPLGYACHVTPLLFFGMANAVLGTLNLFPVQALDGGNALRILLEAYLPSDRAQTVCAVVGEGALLLLTLLSLFLVHTSGYNFSLLMFCAVLFVSLCR